MEINKIYNKNCLIGLQEMEDESVDIVFTDPPYNVGKKYDGYNDNMSSEFYMAWMQDVVNQCRRISRNGIVFYVSGNMTKLFFDLIPDANLIIVYKKAAGVCKNNYAMQYHSILSTARPIKRMRNVWDDVRLPGEGYFFKEQRYDNPGLTGLELTKKVILSFTKEDDIVVDPFMGTGTTAVACKLLQRSFIGYEQSEKYCHIAEDRISLL